MAKKTSLVLTVIAVFAIVPDTCFGLYHYGRNSWGAVEPKDPLADYSEKARVVYLHPTKTDYCGNNNLNCRTVMKSIQRKHMQSDCADIGFNFAVGGCTGVFEGSGWSKKAPFSMDDNVPSVHIAIIGQYPEGQNIPSNVVSTAMSLVQEGINIGKIDSNPTYKCVYFDDEPKGFNVQIPNSPQYINCVKQEENCFKLDYNEVQIE